VALSYYAQHIGLVKRKIAKKIAKKFGELFQPEISDLPGPTFLTWSSSQRYP
jgi:hypothetical protein